MRKDETIRIPLEDVVPLARDALLSAGCNAENADAVAQTIHMAERDGVHSHGLFRIPGYVASLASGKVNGKASPESRRIAPGVLQMDGDGGFAPLAHARLRDPLADLAKEQGIAACALVRTHHFSSLFVEIEQLASRNVIALACTAYKPAMPAAGGKRPVFGTNPLAFGWPRPGREPMVFDQATAVMSRGDVTIAARDNRRLPDGVGIGPDGEPTNDPNEVLKGALLPFGGYKGSAIAMMIELLVGPLIGERTSLEAAEADINDGGPPRGGEFILAIDANRFGAAGQWEQQAERLFAAILDEPGVRLPGDRRRARRDDIERNGVTLPQSLYDSIRSTTPKS